MTNFDISKATAQASHVLTSLCAAETQPELRHAHILDAVKAYWRLGKLLVRIASKPPVSNVVPLRIDRTREPVSPWVHQSNEGVRS